MFSVVLQVAALIVFAASAAYTVFAIIAVVAFGRTIARCHSERSEEPGRVGLRDEQELRSARHPHSQVPRYARNDTAPEATFTPPVTIAKPLCGDEPDLYENLRSFCEQDYPLFQVVFGVSDPDDPAAAVARRLIDELPDRDLELVIDPRVIGANRKISNLAAMNRAMKHGLIVIADSDMRVTPDYLRTVVASLSDPHSGAVTCLYRGTPARPNPASVLGAIAINDSFLPSVLVARKLQPLRYCFGATMAVRRSELEAIGGFEALASQLADDYMLGQLISDRGFEVVLAPYLVDARVFEPSWRALFDHELRWARTIRAMRPASYAGTAMTMTAGWSLVFAASTGFSPWGWIAVAAAATLRLTLHGTVRLCVGKGVPYAPWLLPLRSILSALVFFTAHFGRKVRWKTSQLTVASGGGLSATNSREF